MSAFSHPLSISPERPLDPTTLTILELIDRLLRKAQIPYMLVGATARDLLLYHVHGHVVTRATYDVDFAVLVDSWPQFGVVKRLFLDTPGFTDKGCNTQRLYYQPTGAEFETIIDIIPFGKLETADRTIAWPPDADIVMNVAAFSDVFRTSGTVAIRSDLLIPVPSLAGLTVLKLFAWLDRNDGKDVQDLRRLLETYTDAGNADRLYEQEAEELEFVGFDTVLAGAFLLGKDAQLITDPSARESLSAALTGQRVTALVQQIARAMNIFEDRTEASTALLREFFRGMGLSNIL
jgi:predicted nucleotidyltransferase